MVGRQRCSARYLMHIDAMLEWRRVIPFRRQDGKSYFHQSIKPFRQPLFHRSLAIEMNEPRARLEMAALLFQRLPPGRRAAPPVVPGVLLHAPKVLVAVHLWHMTLQHSCASNNCCCNRRSLICILQQQWLLTREEENLRAPLHFAALRHRASRTERRSSESRRFVVVLTR